MVEEVSGGLPFLDEFVMGVLPGPATQEALLFTTSDEDCDVDALLRDRQSTPSLERQLIEVARKEEGRSKIVILDDQVIKPVRRQMTRLEELLSASSSEKKKQPSSSAVDNLGQGTSTDRPLSPVLSGRRKKRSPRSATPKTPPAAPSEGKKLKMADDPALEAFSQEDDRDAVAAVLKMENMLEVRVLSHRDNIKKSRDLEHNLRQQLQEVLRNREKDENECAKAEKRLKILRTLFNRK